MGKYDKLLRLLTIDASRKEMRNILERTELTTSFTIFGQRTLKSMISYQHHAFPVT